MLFGVDNATEPDRSKNATASDGNSSISFYGHLSSEIVRDVFKKYVSPVILVVGLFGNTLTLFVMRRPHMMGTTTSVYLALMSVVNSLNLLVTALPVWLAACGIFDFVHWSQTTCRLGKFSEYVTSDLSIWILVAFTFDRFVAVRFPMAKSRVCVPRRAWVIFIVLCAGAAAKNLHLFWTRGTVFDGAGQPAKNCGMVAAYRFFEEFVRPWIALTLASILPFCSMSLCNVFIVRALFETTRSRLQMTADGKTRSPSFIQPTVMCVAVSVSFLVLSFPGIIIIGGWPYWDPYSTNVDLRMASVVCNQLMNVTHAVNFFLYCLTGQQFREELVQMLRCSSSTATVTKNCVAISASSANTVATISSDDVTDHAGNKNFKRDDDTSGRRICGETRAGPDIESTATEVECYGASNTERFQTEPKR